MRKYITIVLSVLFGVCVIAVLLCSAVLSVATNGDVYHNENLKLNTAYRTGMSEDDLETVTDLLVSYLRGDAESLDVKASVNGNIVEVFNEKEKIHMVDVKNLFAMLAALNTALIIASLAILSTCLLFFRSRIISFLKGALWTCISIIGVALAILLFAMVDFTSFWNMVHLIFFTNDLWMLDPLTDILIQIMLERFFVDFAVRIGVIAVVLIVLFVAAIIAARYFLGRRQKKARA